MPLSLHEKQFIQEINHLIICIKQCPVPTDSGESLSDVNHLLQETENKIILLEGFFVQGLLSIHHPEKQVVWASNIQRLVRLFSDAVYIWRKQCTAMHHAVLKMEWMQTTEQFLSTIQSFMDSLQKEHAALFDDTQLISYYEKDHFYKEISYQLKKLNKRWKASSKADSRLEEIALLPFLKFLQSEEIQQYDYQKIFFLKILLTNLERIDFIGPAEKDTELLMDGLMRINYNHPLFIDYRQDTIRKRVEAFTDSREQLQYLRQEKKELKQLLYENNKGYNNKGESAHSLIDNFLCYEIQYLETTLNILYEPGPVYDKAAIVEFTIPASSIGILMRVMIAMGVIKTSNLTQMLTRIRPFLLTPKKEPLTEIGFRNDFYSTKKHELNAAKNLLFEMIKWINKLER